MLPGIWSTLEEQDRSLWDRRKIAAALPLVEEALRGGVGAFAVQAAIAALHCEAPRAEDTDWEQILRLFDVLERIQPSPVVTLNRSVAVAMVEGPDAGLESIADLEGLEQYFLLHAARGSTAPRGEARGRSRELSARVDAGYESW